MIVRTARAGGIIERREKEPAGSFFYFGAAGFSVAELIAVLVIIGVLAAVSVPKLGILGSTYDTTKLYDQTLAALRYAQSTATARQRTVCATFSATQLQLTYASTYGGACDSNLMPPGGAGAPYTVTRQGSAGYSGATNFSYDLRGRPTTSATLGLGQTITLVGGTQIVVESETGYVR